MSLITTHILDNATGAPAAGVVVILTDQQGTERGSGTTNADGRIGDLGPEALDPGTYRLQFHTGPYFAAQGVETFFPEVHIAFTVGQESHYHVPLLLSPYAYSTYRGS